MEKKLTGSPSKNKITIVIDVMGGDNAPYAPIAGVLLALYKFPDVIFNLVGDKKIITEQLDQLKYKNSEAINIIHTDKYIQSDEKPSIALRNSKNTSMRVAIEQVRDGVADAVVSSGNTGALMAIGKVILKTLPNINRPAIAASMPTAIKDHSMVLLDAGANTECSSEVLFQFAVMGDAFAKVTYGVNNPRIGLLNIGTEDVKGNDVIKSAWNLIKEEDNVLNFSGYVEGDDILSGNVDVVVTDGFTGNVALKTIEGTAKFCKVWFKEALKSSVLARLGALLSAPALKRKFNILDHRKYNGALLVGLNGVVVKSHGSADDIAFFNAIDKAVSLVKNHINDRINDVMSKYSVRHKGDEQSDDE
jgi:phosphate acyltransferase